MSAAAPLRRVWRELPLWYLWLSPFSLLDAEVNVLGRPRGGALLGFIPVFAVVTLARLRSGGGRRHGAYFAVSGLLLLGILVGTGMEPPSRHTLLRIFEISALVVFGAMAVHCYTHAGSGVLRLLFGVGLLYGLFLENVGVASGVFAEDGYWIYLPGLPAPLATALGWCTVWYCLWWMTPRLTGPRPGREGRAAISLGLALLLDLQIDPVATSAGFWTWNETLAPRLRGVPLVNFNAWAAAVWPFARQVYREAVTAGALVRRLPTVLLQAFLILAALSLVTESASGWPSARLFLALLGLG